MNDKDQEKFENYFRPLAFYEYFIFQFSMCIIIPLVLISPIVYLAFKTKNKREIKSLTSQLFFNSGPTEYFNINNFILYVICFRPSFSRFSHNFSTQSEPALINFCILITMFFINPGNPRNIFAILYNVCTCLVLSIPVTINTKERV